MGQVYIFKYFYNKLYMKEGVNMSKKHKRSKEEYEGLDDLDIYEEDNMARMLEDDEISDAEFGFMQGYNGED